MLLVGRCPRSVAVTAMSFRKGISIIPLGVRQVRNLSHTQAILRQCACHRAHNPQCLLAS